MFDRKTNIIFANEADPFDFQPRRMENTNQFVDFIRFTYELQNPIVYPVTESIISQPLWIIY